MNSRYPWLDKAWSVFQSSLNSDKLPHAILIHGPEGTGKRALAERMLERLVCTDAGETACGACRSCSLFRSGAHPDWFLLEPEEGKHQIGIDQVRETIAALTLTASFSPYKLALITPAEAMNNHSANALLKSLEEPPGDTIMILVSHDASRLPVTIRSRCQSIVVALPEPGVAQAWVAEQPGMDASMATEALRVAGGSPLRAVELAGSGDLELHRRLHQQLSQLLGRPGLVTRASSELSDISTATLWSWLSNSSAELLSSLMQNKPVDWLPSERPIDPRKLADLQQGADRNRQLAKTPVRQDLLLQDWLIRWSRLAN